MSWTKTKLEVRKMRFEEIYKKQTEKTLTVEQAAQILGVSESTFRRLSTSYEEEVAEGLADGRVGRAAHNVAPVDEVTELLTLFETHYGNYNVSHFYDKYRDQPKGERCYTWVKNQLQEAGYVKKAKKRGQHRRKRPRQPMKGMMLHQDGSSHEWVMEQEWDLIVTMDDADSEIYSAFFVEEEGTWSSFQGVRDVIGKHGLFCSMYLDRGSHYFYTPTAGGKVDLSRPTQFGRAMQNLGVKLIPAYSPEARGRSERMFGTLQGRLPQELQTEGVVDMDKANQFLREHFIPKHNERFKKQPEERSSAFIPLDDAGIELKEVLCVLDERTVGKDNTISYNNSVLQIPKDKYRWSYLKTKVTVHEYEDRSLSIYYGQRCLGRYTADGQLK